MLISGAVDRKVMKKGRMKELASKLPFIQEPDLGLALVVKSYLDEQSNEPSKRQDITKWFNYVLDLEGDLQKAWKLWTCVSNQGCPTKGDLLTLDRSMLASSLRTP